MKKTILAITIICAMLYTWADVSFADTNTINACKNTSDGTIRIVDSLTLCKKSESPLSWNIVGPTGPTGPTGPAGADLTKELCLLYNLTEHTPPSSIQCPSVKFVFVSSSTFDGNLGGVAGADSNCQALATGAHLPGTYKAWISDSLGNSPSTTFTQSAVPYVDVAGNLIASDWTDLTDGTLANPISIDENGRNLLLENSVVWTGTGYGGTSVNQNCQNWSTASFTTHAVFGVMDVTNLQWTFQSSLPCFVSSHIYCFQQ